VMVVGGARVDDVGCVGVGVGVGGRPIDDVWGADIE
jgi:hypothetical protein